LAEAGRTIADADLIGVVLVNSPGMDTPLRLLTSANALASRARATVAPRRDEEAGLHTVGPLVPST